MEEAIVVNKGDDELIDLPPGFRFHPTDEEIITHYLTEKVMNSNFSASAIGEVDLNKCEPWDLPKKAKMGEKQWYFFCQRDRKYPTGMRTNRATEAGYWKATGKDKEIFKGKGCLVGMKKTLVFYKGRAPKGEKSNWVMHEYRLEGKFSYYNLPKGAKDEWVVCRVFDKNNTGTKKSPIPDHHQLLRMNSYGDDFMDYASLPPLMDPTYNSNKPGSSCTFMDGGDNEFKAAINNQTFLQVPPNHPYGSSNIFNPQIPIQNPIVFHQATPTSTYVHQGRTTAGTGFAGNDPANRQCKVEQFSSNQSMVSLSQDTGLSTEINNNEISSVVSKNDMGFGISKSFEDLRCLWDY
ncbi:NAC domain-containing protein 87 [Gossypium raimondii]|uniref:NAC domain protein 8 n=2 Tax=Gossypium TaxID=3633 RepID=U5IJP4_GOSHI|nr:NAC domain-containing protein 92-like [Gossypium hirsutum]XP_012492652.1 NAC domain-containing protein 87 [Gossypium raimondii]AGC27311.1 NAC domain protein 8 [Gossypium hirsutum]KJB44709.1 hypothetical protein B456_007G267700 [Gossypium raimondii]MBA0590905.1 hypothetical protein [Gossypium raimondii]